MGQTNTEKPTHVKPAFYSCCYEELKKIARKYGYNLILHGSMNRDMDLIAIPWVDKPKPERAMIKAFDMYLRGGKATNDRFEHEYMFSILPGGRKSYVINLNRGGYINRGGQEKYEEDKQWYLDISITPLTSAQPKG